MPLRRSARIAITNEGQQPIDAFYFNIDYQTHRSLPDDVAYFHAQFRQATPNRGWTIDWKSNGDDIVDKKANLTGDGDRVRPRQRQIGQLLHRGVLVPERAAQSLSGPSGGERPDSPADPVWRTDEQPAVIDVIGAR